MKTKSANSLPKIEPLPGSVCRQYIRCGRSNCKCANGMLHGPYYYRFWYVGGRLHKSYVKKADIGAILAACSAYKQEQRALRLQMRVFMDEWRSMRALLRRVGL